MGRGAGERGRLGAWGWVSACASHITYVHYEVNVFKALPIALRCAHSALKTLGSAYGWIAKHIGQWS